ncbi:MAG TPA: hypothetical protein VIL78_17255 [Hanamia sp.]|jgi:hypothetical protein
MKKDNSTPEEFNMNVQLRPENAGLMETLTIVPMTATNPTGAKKNAMNLREFKIMGTIFSVPPLWNSNVVSGKLSGGSSLLQIEESEYQSFEITRSIDQASTFTVHLNEHKQLSAISCTLKATNWDLALKAFHNFVNPYLSLLSWKYHVPLTISNINGIDIENECSHANFIQPIPIRTIKIMGEKPENFDDRIAALFSFHRELVNSTSGPYRLLCVYKCLTIIKSIKRHIHDLAKKANLDLKDYKTQTEIKIESNETSLNVWPDAIGWTLGRLVNDKVRPIRNKIAHELDEGDSFANPDLGILKEEVRAYADGLVPLMRMEYEKVITYYNQVFFPALQ